MTALSLWLSDDSTPRPPRWVPYAICIAVMLPIYAAALHFILR